MGRANQAVLWPIIVREITLGGGNEGCITDYRSAGCLIIALRLRTPVGGSCAN